MGMEENTKINDEMMAEAAGGANAGREPIEGVVLSAWEDPFHDKWLVETSPNNTRIASCDIIGVELPGKRVKIALVAMGAFKIVEILD
ncbi:MAG: hypothetical protein K6A72_05065 [Lachnospiraceae bacterium]|nr:hypothetical protein [Lachnospiraceae bacterium]